MSILTLCFHAYSPVAYADAGWEPYNLSKIDIYSSTALIKNMGFEKLIPLDSETVYKNYARSANVRFGWYDWYEYNKDGSAKAWVEMPSVDGNIEEIKAKVSNNTGDEKTIHTYKKEMPWSYPIYWLSNDVLCVDQDPLILYNLTTGEKTKIPLPLSSVFHHTDNATTKNDIEYAMAWSGYPVGISDDGTQIVYVVSLGDYRILLLYNFIENKWTSVDAIKTDSANESVTFQNGKITWGLTERTNAGYSLNIYEYTLQTKEKKRIFHSNAYENYYDIRLVEYSDNTVVYYQGADKRRLVVYDIADKKIKYRMEIGFVPESRGILKIDEFCYYLLGAEDDIYFFNLKENVIYHMLINKHFEHHFMEHNGQLILIIDDKFYRLKI